MNRRQFLFAAVCTMAIRATLRARPTPPPTAAEVAAYGRALRRLYPSPWMTAFRSRA